MKFDFSNPMFPKPKTEKRRGLLRWQEELEHTRVHFGRLLHNTPRIHVRRLEWSETRGYIDIVFNIRILYFAACVEIADFTADTYAYACHGGKQQHRYDKRRFVFQLAACV